MPLDALCLTAVAGELRRSLLGGKIDKIYQPAREELLLCIRGRGENVRLLLSANPGHPRAHLTTRNRENPDTPPMFCMLLRKHLLGGRILELKQPPMERLLDFRLETIDELGDRVERRLVLEALGRNSNLILLDGEGRIIDCLRRVDGDMSRQRQVLPGLFYRLPPAPDKLDPMALDGDETRNGHHPGGQLGDLAGRTVTRHEPHHPRARIMGRHRLGRRHRTAVHELVHIPQDSAIAAEQAGDGLVLHRRQILHLVDDQMAHGRSGGESVGAREGQGAQHDGEGVLPFHHALGRRLKQGALARVG